MKILIGMCFALATVVCAPPADLPASSMPRGFSNQDYNNINNLLGTTSSEEEPELEDEIDILSNYLTPSQLASLQALSQNQPSLYTATGPSSSYPATQPQYINLASIGSSQSYAASQAQQPQYTATGPSSPSSPYTASQQPLYNSVGSSQSYVASQQPQYIATGPSSTYTASQQPQYQTAGSSQYQNSLQSRAYYVDSIQSQTYENPQSKYGPPQPQYGAPHGSSYEDEGDWEDENYEFGYVVKDDHTGCDFGHKESRQGGLTQGTYYVVLPDGRKQIVMYEADKNGYRPKITYEDGYPAYGSGGNHGNSGYPASQSSGGGLLGSLGGYSY